MEFAVWERVVISLSGRTQRTEYYIVDNKDGSEVDTDPFDSYEAAQKECDELNLCEGCDDPDCYCDG